VTGLLMLPRLMTCVLPTVAIERNMRMSDDDQVRIAASQPLLQLVIAVLGLESGSVVSSWRSMNAEQTRAIG
jgi:hypothetical protein